MIPEMMRAWQVCEFGPIAIDPLELVELSVPQSGLGEILVRMLACGVCLSTAGGF